MSPNSIRSRILGLIHEDALAPSAATLAFAAGAVLTAMLVSASADMHQRRLDQRFNLLASERFSRIQERFDDQVQRLDGLRRFFVFSDQITQAEFDGYAAPLLALTQAYSWAPRVSGAERSQFEARARGLGLTGFTVRELSPGGELKPAVDRPEYFPVLYTQSRSTEPLPLGFDVKSESIRRTTLERALQRGSMAVSPRMDLVGLEPANTRGLLLVAPVLLSVVDGRAKKQALSGYVMAVIGLRTLMSEGLPAQDRDNLALQLFDLSSSEQPELLYQSANQAVESSLRISTLLSMADRRYLLELRPSAAFVAANQSSSTSVIVLGGLLSLILSALLYSLVNQRQRALLLVERRTAELRSVLNAATQVAIIATNLRGVISTFNVGAQKMLGYSGDQVLGQFTLGDLHLGTELLAHGEQLSQRYGREVPTAEAMLVEAMEEGTHPAREWTLVRRDGSSLVVNMLVTAVRDERQQWVGYLAICVDITEGKRAHQALAARDQLLEKLSAQVPGGIYQYQLNSDGSSFFTYANSGMWRIYELPHDLKQQGVEAVLDRIHPMDMQRIKKSICYSAEHLTPWREEYRVELPRQGQRWLQGEAMPERLPDGGVLWHGFISDISDLKRVEDELRALSVTDVLTGVYNRRYFQERLKAELSRVHRHGGELSVIMLDIDHFKRINDQFGHAMGDHVLQGLCQRINQRLRQDDVFCRLGGEEFMVLCPNATGENAHALALELWQVLRGEPIEGVGVVTASFGVASWRPVEGGDSLLLRADSGVYAAKQAGRDRVEPELS